LPDLSDPPDRPDILNFPLYGLFANRPFFVFLRNLPLNERPLNFTFRNSEAGILLFLKKRENIDEKILFAFAVVDGYACRVRQCAGGDRGGR
jgi:hypothetical protein